MPKVGAKRQITLPIEQCEIAGIEPGDECLSFVDSEGRITIVKKPTDGARGVLTGIQTDVPREKDRV